MKIAIVSKYPPIEGGVSSRTYWLAKGLGEKGNKVYVVSNCWEAENSYREFIEGEENGMLEPHNVNLFSTTSDFRSPILNSRYYTARIASILMDVIRHYDIDVVYSHYLLPYGISASMAKLATNKPLVVQHAGSDITRLFSHNQLKSIFIEVFKNADRVFAYSNTRAILSSCNINPEKFVFIPFSVNTKEFSPSAKGFDIDKYTSNYDNKPTIFSYFGKVSGLKKTHAFVDALAEIKNENFIAIFVVGQNKQVDELRAYANSKNLPDKCIFLPFQPPWKIPQIMNMSDCIVCPESHEEPYLPKGTHGPVIAREAMACGKCAMIGKGIYEKGYYKNTKNGENILVVNPDDVKDFASKLVFVINNKDEIKQIGAKARNFAVANEDFDNYINSMVRLFESLL